MASQNPKDNSLIYHCSRTFVLKLVAVARGDACDYGALCEEAGEG